MKSPELMTAQEAHDFWATVLTAGVVTLAGLCLLVAVGLLMGGGRR